MDRKKDESIIFTGVQTRSGEVAVRVSDTEIKVGTVKEFTPDAPVGTEVIKVEGDGPVKTVTEVSHVSGPPKCNSDDFRAGWERIFGGRREVAQA